MGDPAGEAAARVAAAAEDPSARLALAEEVYARHLDAAGDSHDLSRWARGELAFLRWEIRRGTLAPLDGPRPGSPVWRAVNDRLLRDSLEALFLAEHGGISSGPAVDHWLAFLAAPSAATWYRAHNNSVIRGYLEQAALALQESPAEQDFLGLTLTRVLCAEAAVAGTVPAAPPLRRFIAVLADPRHDGVREVTGIPDFYPQHYPMTSDDARHLGGHEHSLHALLPQLLDHEVQREVRRIYEGAAAAHGLDELRLLLDGAKVDYPQALLVRQGQMPAAASTGAPSDRRWTDSELDRLRQVADPLADDLVARYFETADRPAHAFVGALVRGGDEDAAALVDAYLTDRRPLPDWVEPDRLRRAADFFESWGPEVLILLGCSSLPDAYAAARGVQVLHLTARLETDAKRRLIETAQMVIDVLSPGGLELGGAGRTTARKVRLMHAGVRHLIAHDPRIARTCDPGHDGARWCDEWGVPVNQEDLLGTVTTFTWNVIDGLRRLGVPVTGDEADDWVHAWNVVGHLIGIPDDHLPADWEATVATATIIRRRNHAPSDAGTAMTDVLVRTLQDMVPSRLLDGMPVSVSRATLGADTADMLGVPPADWTRMLLPAARWSGRRYARVSARHRLLRWCTRRVGHAFLDMAERFERGPHRPTFAIPEHLADRWGRT